MLRAGIYGRPCTLDRYSTSGMMVLSLVPIVALGERPVMGRIVALGGVG